MGKSQQVKGKAGEREVVKILEQNGFMARRGQVWNGEPDIICPELPIHWEVKRHETLEVDAWFAQAEEYARRLIRKKYPVVVYRQSRKPWMVTMKVADFFRLVLSYSHNIYGDIRMTMKFEEFLEIMRRRYGREDNNTYIP